MIRPACLLAFSAALLPATLLFATPSLAQSAEKGKAAFAQCAACHGTKPGEKKMGPTLAGGVGRKAGTLAGPTAPSPARAQFRKTRAAKDPNALPPPRARRVPGPGMGIGVPDAARRADSIASRATLK